MHRSLVTAAVLLFGTSCPVGAPTHREPTPVPTQASAVSTTAPPRAEPKAPIRTVDRYAAWATWSESLVHPECLSDADCRPDRTGDPTYCFRRQGVPDSDLGTCKPRWLNRKRQAIQRDNQRRIVEAICEPPGWYDPERDAEGRACWRFEWRTAKACNAKRWCNPEKLHRFLRVPAKRESTWNHKTDHRLNPDLLANIGSYRRMYARGDRNPYKGNPHFFAGLTLDDRGRAVFGRGGKPLSPRLCIPLVRAGEEAAGRQNPLDRNCNGVPDRWERGYGWYGLNAANFTFEWDGAAPPEVLARRVPATLAVLRKARSAWRKLSNGIDCNDREETPWSKDNRRPSWKACENPKAGYAAYGQPDCRETLRADLAKDTWQKPTWWSVHRAVWGGDVCPETMGDADFRERMFANRARKVGLDLHEQIPLEMLGAPIAAEDQWELVDRIESAFVAVFPQEE